MHIIVRDVNHVIGITIPGKPNSLIHIGPVGFRICRIIHFDTGEVGIAGGVEYCEILIVLVGHIQCSQAVIRCAERDQGAISAHIDGCQKIIIRHQPNGIDEILNPFQAGNFFSTHIYGPLKSFGLTHSDFSISIVLYHGQKSTLEIGIWNDHQRIITIGVKEDFFVYHVREVVIEIIHIIHIDTGEVLVYISDVAGFEDSDFIIVPIPDIQESHTRIIQVDMCKVGVHTQV